MLDLILFLVIDPILSFISRRIHSGRWHFTYLLPLVCLVFAGVIWLGAHWDSGLLIVIGAVGCFCSAVLNLFLFIPREIGEWKDLRDYVDERKRKAEQASQQDATEKKEVN